MCTILLHSKSWKWGEWDVTLSLHIAKLHQCNILFKIFHNGFFLKPKNLFTFSPPDKAALSDNMKYEDGLDQEQSAFFCEIAVWQSIQPSQALRAVIIQPITFSCSSGAAVTVSVSGGSHMVSIILVACEPQGLLVCPAWLKEICYRILSFFDGQDCIQSQIFYRNQHSAVHHLETVGSQYHIENSGVPYPCLEVPLSRYLGMSLTIAFWTVKLN